MNKSITALLLAMVGCNSTSLDRAPEVDTTGTLRLVVTIANADPADPTPGTAAIVVVREVSTNALVSGAVVRVGQAGSMAQLPELQAPYTGEYQAIFPAFAEGWDVSVERGADHIRGLHLVGPSDPAVSVLDDNDGLVVKWDPAHQDGVNSDIALTRLQPQPDPYGGPLRLTASLSSDDGSAGPFVVPRSSGDAYDIALTLSHDYDGAWGTAGVSVQRRTLFQDP